MLSANNFILASEFIKNNARPLDIALYNYEFNKGPREDLIEELIKYQNPDGGFGKGIEPDIQLPTSSVQATTIGLQYCNEMDISSDHDIVKKAINYLLSNMKKSENKIYWYQTNLDVNDYPHAPWWNLEKVEPPVSEEWANPSAEVIGYLNKYNHYVPSEILKGLNEYIENYLTNQKQITGFIYYKFLCWKRSIMHFPRYITKLVLDLFDNTFDNSVHLDPTNFGHLKIQWFVTEKTSYLNEKFPKKIRLLMELETKRMNEDGGWYPGWEWHSDTDNWEKIKMEWAGKITRETLGTYKYFDLIGS